ncbi:MAG: antibiotic biosynthesis monooxygenase [Pseudomonadota bacterium]|nr:antibiotic biosynthesis monooxygenase [Pseudomonadota bacterium]
MHVVTVEFVVHPESIEPFMQAMLVNARASLEKEPGCTRFDVCVDPENPSHVFLYELYSDAAAFEAHLRTEHFKSFDALVAPWLQSKRVKRWELVQ